jgi:hypothetical protein
MSITVRTQVVLASCLLLGLALPACGKSGTQGKTSQRNVTVKVGGAAAPGSVTANVAEFDPNADISLDMDKFGPNTSGRVPSRAKERLAGHSDHGGCATAQGNFMRSWCF